MHSISESSGMWEFAKYWSSLLGSHHALHDTAPIQEVKPLLRRPIILHYDIHGLQFRLCVLAYRCVHGTAPAYLANSLQLTADVPARRRLCSTDSTRPMLQVPPTWRSTIGDRAFPVAAARWNSLPPATRAANSLLQFRREAKTHVFGLSFRLIRSSCCNSQYADKTFWHCTVHHTF